MIGEKLGPFLIDEKIGSGAMGIVYRATMEPQGQIVAIKVIAESAAARNNAAERFDRESDILKQFRHPNIVQHVGAGFSRSRGLRYYAMEYVPGVTIEEVLNEKGPMPWTEVVRLGLQICDALQYAHERGIVHRDLKPSNLMVTNRGDLKLTDFGIAKDLDRTALTADGRTLGTAAYMAPEQIRGTPEVSHKTDLYALGCVLYQMLTGRAPFEGKTALQLMHKHLEEDPPRPSDVVADVPKALDQLILSLMAKNRDDRPWDALAAAETLRALEARQGRGEKVAMVHDDLPANPTRLGTQGEPADTAGGTKTRKPGRKRPSDSDFDAGDPGRLRARLELASLVAALLGLAGFVAYMFWPPSEAYLFRKAAEGMASPERADRNWARERYIAELDRRFPEHPYKPQVRAWRDQLLLEDIDRRARFLESPALAALTQINDEIERNYAQTHQTTLKDLEQGLDLDALERWRNLARLLQDEAGSNEKIRAWYLRSKFRADALQVEIERRIKAAAPLVQKFTAAQLVENAAEAERARRELVDQFGKYQSMRPVLAPLEALAPRAGPEEEPGAPAAEGVSTPAAP